MKTPETSTPDELGAAPCSLIYSAWLEDWFVIEPCTGTGQPEGNGEEWREIIAAMKERRSMSFKRIGVMFDSQGDAWFWSPRNSMHRDAASVPAARVDEWTERATKIVDAYSANDRLHGREGSAAE